jgi:digeranylgeranylglycerophospholipid reductase
MIEVDALIVGGGPAGLCAAKTISKEGFDCIVLEKNSEIGSPIKCAGGISRHIFQDAGIRKNDIFIRQEINKTKFYYYDEVYELATDLWKGYVVERKIFNKYLARDASNAGAQILVETKATGIEDRYGKKIAKVKSALGIEEIKSKIIIGADGANSTVGRLAGIRPLLRADEFASCINYEISGFDLKDNDAWHFIFSEEFPSGYGWIFPKGRDSANIGVSVSGKHKSTSSAFRFLFKKVPVVLDLLGDKYSVLSINRGIYPVCGPKPVNEIVSDGILLAGDAACIINPITGEGIAPAMLSGIAAGETACLALKDNKFDKDNLIIYDKKWRSKKYMGGLELGKDLDNAVLNKDAFFDAFSSKVATANERKEMIEAIK